MTTKPPKLSKLDDGSWEVKDGETVLGRVRQEETSRTAYKRGYVAGQRACLCWRVYAPRAEAGHTPAHPKNHSARFGSPGGFTTRRAAVAALVEWAGNGYATPANA